jgi:site-specific recombinase XerD
MMFNTILNTWLRRNEISNLKIENIFNQYITVKSGKWNKDRIVYISKSFSKQLQDYIEIQNKNTEYLFCDSSWIPITNDGINRLFKSIQQWSWIKVYPHLLRHTYASLCVKRGINIYTLQQQLWHTDLKTTSIYLYMNSNESWEEMQKLSI